jgi:hypothetical protein
VPREKMVCCASNTEFTAVIIIICFNTMKSKDDTVWISSRGVASLLLESVIVFRCHCRPQKCLLQITYRKDNIIMLSLRVFRPFECCDHNSVKILNPAGNDLWLVQISF